jgi:hypothetical protein
MGKEGSRARILLGGGGGSTANALRSLRVDGWGGVDDARARGRAAPREGVSAESMNAEHETARLVTLRRRRSDTELAVWGSLVHLPASCSPIAWLGSENFGLGRGSGSSEDCAKKPPGSPRFGRKRANSALGSSGGAPGGCTSVAYLRITDFNTRTVGELKEVVRRVRKEAGPQGVGIYAVDLRDNMGGLLSAAIQVPFSKP